MYETVEINGSILRVVMQERNISRDKLADKMGISGRTIWNWIWDENDPTKENFYKLCEALKIPPRLLACSSSDLVEMGRTSRIIRFHTKELMGTNDDPTYAETQLIHQDLVSEATDDAAEEETREEDLTISGAQQPHSDSESSAETDDDMHWSRSDFAG